MADDCARVLVPLDGSPEAEEILSAISPLRSARPVRVTVFGAVPPHTSAAAVRPYLLDVARRLTELGVTAEVRTDWGSPAEEILWLGKRIRFDLIAMSTHGRTGYPRLRLGSVAEEVLRRTEVPLLLHRRGTPTDDWRRIVVALDGTAAGQEILGDVAAWAKPLGSAVHLLRVVPPPVRASEYRRNPFVFPEEDPLPYLDGVSGLLARSGMFAVRVAREGEPAREVTRYAQEIRAGLICIMTHGRRGLRRVLGGSVAERVVRAAPCPVLVRRMSEVVLAETEDLKKVTT